MSSSTSSVTLCVKWGKETLKVESFAPSSGASSLLQQLSDRTNVPLDRVKLLSKSKGLWKGVLTANTDLSSLDWETASKNGGEIQVLLMGSASQVVAPPASARTVFLEDLPPEEAAAIVEPSGLANLGNTCYLNSVVQCLRAVEPLRRGLEQFATISAAATTSNSATSNNNNNNGGVSKLLISSLQDTLRRLDRQATAVEPAMLVQATRVNFPQFAQRGPHGHPQQQDAEVRNKRRRGERKQCCSYAVYIYVDMLSHTHTRYLFLGILLQLAHSGIRRNTRQPAH
jgi:ubiquitin carboxyl-terminal hydrolase 14